MVGSNAIPFRTVEIYEVSVFDTTHFRGRVRCEKFDCLKPTGERGQQGTSKESHNLSGSHRPKSSLQKV
jgi:hypothetical protein